MKYALKILALLLIAAPVGAEEPELGYQEQLEAAVVQSNISKVTRMLKRRNRTSVKNFNHMLGWANDTIEERRILLPTTRELLIRVGSIFAAAFGGIAGFNYYFDIGNMRSDVRDDFFGQERGFFTLLGLTGLFSSYGFYLSWTGPRARLADSYRILFALEDTIDAMEKKKKAQAVIALKRSLRSKRIT